MTPKSEQEIKEEYTFVKHNKIGLKVDCQYFDLDYHPTTKEELCFMQNMLAKALTNLIKKESSCDK